MFKKILKSLLSVGLIFAVALLGAWGGQEKKWLRRFVLPATVTIYAYFLLQNWWVLTVYSMAGVLSIGYGIVSPDDDKPSFLGKVAYKLFPKSQPLQNIFCRGIIGTLLSLSMLSVPIITKNWVSYFVGSLVIVLVWAVVSYRGFGETRVKLFGKEVALLNVDLTTYAVTALGFVLIINGWIK
jgi:hypothetical protein